MKKSEIIAKINAIPFEQLNAAAYFIEHSNPWNALSKNRAYTVRNTVGGICTGIKIGFLSHALKADILDAYHAILDEIVVRFGLEAAQEIEPGYRPEWYEEPEQEQEEPAQITETRIMTAEDLRALCIEKEWYTYGNNEEYRRLFTRLKNENGTPANMTPAKLYEIAEDIRRASDWKWTTPAIMFELARICCSFFEII